MALKLEKIKKFVEDQMSDQFLIERDPQGYADDTYNPNTMSYLGPAGDREQVYIGPGFMVSTDTGVAQTILEGGENYDLLIYDLFIPLETPPLEKWDRVKVMAALRDAHLLNTVWYVSQELTGTFAVCRQIRCLDRIPSVSYGLLQ